MRFHHLRSATTVLDVAGKRVLVDPMLAAKGTHTPFAAIRHKARRNPTVELPPNADSVLADLDAALVSHCRFGHVDHFDQDGIALIKERDLPTYCHSLDETWLRKRGLRTEPMVPHWPREFFSGTVTAYHAVHGYGWIAKPMGPGAGYLIEAPGEPSIYFSGDTVLTDEVKRVLTIRKPDIAVMHAGSASIDVGPPILMGMTDLLEFTRLAPGRVIATHLEAINHCPTTRANLAGELEKVGLRDKVLIPQDGETLDL
jgi:L-ascorbate metabolism protein UlaG (beta-lactamase superfamily)